MKQWLKRFGYFIAFWVWLLVMLFPMLAFLLAAKEELQIGQQDEPHLRLFLLQETSGEGIGVEWQREIGQPNGCAKTTVTYLLWEGDAEIIRYCQCQNMQTGALLPPEDAMCR